MTTQEVMVARRQQVLNFLNKHGEATNRQIREVLGLSKTPVLNVLRTMREFNEVSMREERKGQTFTVYYRALVRACVREKPVQRHPVRTHIVHLGAQNEGPPNNPHPGGQGAIRRTVGIVSSASFLLD